MTKLGRLVKDGRVTTIEDIYHRSIPILVDHSIINKSISGRLVYSKSKEAGVENFSKSGLSGTELPSFKEFIEFMCYFHSFQSTCDSYK